jgi:hypothetical protein
VIGVVSVALAAFAAGVTVGRWAGGRAPAGPAAGPGFSNRVGGPVRNVYVDVDEDSLLRHLQWTEREMASGVVVGGPVKGWRSTTRETEEFWRRNG